MKPYLVSGVKSADGKTVETFNPQEYGQLMTSDEAATLTQMMEQVVQSGTATGLADSPYNAVGKTGSAEYSSSSSDSHAWFTGFAPKDDPQICVTIIMEKAGSGGHMAVPVAKRIFDEYFGVNSLN
jgi:peptidoglycan glycosyltransferase